MQKINKILFMGHNKWAVLSLKALIDNGYDIVGVITETDEFDKKEKDIYKSFLKFNAYASLKENANKLNCKIFQPTNINSPIFIKKIKSLEPDLAIIVSYHGILKDNFLKTIKTINIHGALLPKYRGRAPINWSIINGEKKIGITSHHVTTRVDCGKIIEQIELPILKSDRAIDVLVRSLPIYPKIVLSSIKKLEIDPEYGFDQDENESLYFPKRNPQDGLIDWNREKSIDIYNKIRALAYPYPCARTYCKGNLFLINSCSVIDSEKRISPVSGLVVRKDKDAVFVTTIDGLIKIKSLIKDNEEIPASILLKIGQKLSS